MSLPLFAASNAIVTSLPVIDVAPFVSGGATLRLRSGQALRLRSGQLRFATPAVAPASSTSSDMASTRDCRRGSNRSAGASSHSRSRRSWRSAWSSAACAWRGYFPVRGELTRGRPDLKEGLYFGAELPDDHPRVAAGTPLHGRNLFPDIPGFRETVLDYIGAMTRLGHALMQGFGLSLGLDASYFDDRYTRDPLVLFRIFNYPASSPRYGEPEWGVGRAHRLRPAHDPEAGRRRRAAGERTVGLDRRAADSRFLRLQHRRHARPDDRRRSTARRRTACTTRAAAPACRFLFSSIRASTPTCGRSRLERRSDRRTTRRTAGTGRASTSSAERTAITFWRRCRRSFPICAAR